MIHFHRVGPAVMRVFCFYFSRFFLDDIAKKTEAGNASV